MKSSKGTPDNSAFDNNFEELWKELLFNYFSCSFGVESKMQFRNNVSTLDELSSDLRKLMEDRIAEKIFKTRNILVVGAGASIDAYTGIPGGSMLIQKVKNLYGTKLEADVNFRNRWAQDEKEILAITGKEELKFENYLYLLSRNWLTQSKIRSEIENMTSFRYAPVYFNEVVAHMLKHSMLDAVINFNFEETLDQSIFDEIGPGNYYNVISDGHCIDLDKITADGTLKVPIYIKPHGTNSHKSTLRFTNKHYFDIPNDIVNMLKCLVGGFKDAASIEILERPYSSTDIKFQSQRDRIEAARNNLANYERLDRVNLILVGFNNESIEFLDILNNYLPDKSKIFYINIEEPSDSLKTEIYDHRLKNFLTSASLAADCNEANVNSGYDKAMRFLICGDFDNKKKVETGLSLWERKNHLSEATWENSIQPLGRLFHYLYSSIWNSYKKPYRPQHIHRHKLTSLLFYDYRARNPKGISDLCQHEILHGSLKLAFELHSTVSNDYFLDRTIVEIAIALLRSNGCLDYFELEHGRVGYYYKKYFTSHVTDANLLSLPQILESFNLDGIKDTQIQNNFLYIKNEKVSSSNSKDRIPSPVKSEFQAEFRRLKKGQGIYAQENKILAKERGELCEKILGLLITNEFLSDAFFERLTINAPRIKGLQRRYLNTDQQYCYEEMNFYQMVVLSAYYLVSDNFYSISTNHKISNLYTWQSFRLANQIHTNLSLDHEINASLNKDQHNIVLSVSEVGGNIKGHLAANKHKNVKYVQICSLEAVWALHRKSNATDGPGKTDISKLIETHKGYLLNGNKSIKLDLLLIPFTLHNHHMTLFSFADPSTNVLSHLSAVYIWRRGFSNKMNPVIMKKDGQPHYNQCVENDLNALYALFLKYFIRGQRVLEKTKKMKLKIDEILAFDDFEKGNQSKMHSWFPKYLTKN